MTIVVPLNERMKSESEFGLFHIYSKIGKTKAEELREEGFEVIDSKEVNYYPRFHRISWEHATVKGDIRSLDEKEDVYTFPQKLWITATKAKSNIC